jgi:hypothetical protein
MKVKIKCQKHSDDEGNVYYSAEFENSIFSNVFGIGSNKENAKQVLRELATEEITRLIRKHLTLLDEVAKAS